jgi:multidrug resistance efflux pump
MNGNGQIVEETPALRLPELEHISNTGTRLVNRAVSVTLLLLAALFAIGLIVAFVVEIDITIKGMGILEPAAIWPVHSQESGIIKNIFIRTGDTVNVGQALVELDSLTLASTLAQLQSESELKRIEYQRAKSLAKFEERQQADLLEQAKARLIKAKADYRKSLVEHGFNISGDSAASNYAIGKHVGIDIALSDVLAAEAEVRYSNTRVDLLEVNQLNIEKQRVELEQLEKQIRIMKERLGRLIITSSASGIVLTEQLERLIGSYVQAGDLLLEIADTEQWQATLYIKEQDVHRIHLGDVVKAEVQAFRTMDDDLLYGRVVSVSSEPISPNQKINSAFAGLYRVTAALDDRPLAGLGREKLKRGYSVRGAIITKSGKTFTLLWNNIKEKAKTTF